MKTLWIPRLLLLGLGTSLLTAQSATSTTPPQLSIAEMARKIRAEKANSIAPKAKRVFDNDSMPHDPNARPSAASGAVDGTNQKDAKADKGAKGDKADKADNEKPQAEDEPAWRGRFAKLRGNLDEEARRLDLMQRELNLAQIQNYSDPNQAMREQFARTELTKRTAEIEQQKQLVDAAKKAVADLEEEARLKGVPPAWTQP